MRILFILSFLQITLNAFAQNEGNIWYFGQNAGIDFNGSTPLPLTNGSINTNEGCSSISDHNGNILFYTDGVTVYNANHVAMPNGTGLNGNFSSTQSAIIVQDPGVSHLYYIFTINGFAIGGGLYYSIVDMSLQGGLGDVTSLNNLVVTNTTEKVTAVKHANGIDFWIITLLSQQAATGGFHSYLLTSSGLNLTPIVTALGQPQRVGYLKSNRQGDRIAVANFAFNANKVQLYDFDKSTGTLSNELSFDKENAYGVEFSPNGNLLYVSCASSIENLFQYNLQAGTGTITDIVNSEVNLTASTGLMLGGAVQIGPDLKIYHAIAPQGSLGVINNPNVIGVGCNYSAQGFSLGGAISGLGLPMFFNSIYDLGSTISYNVCEGDSAYFYNSTFQNHNWALANTPAIIISMDSAITVSPNISTDYVLYDGLDTIFYHINVHSNPIVDLGPDFSICPGNYDTLIDLSGTNGASYLWQDGSTNDNLIITKAKDYWLQVTDSNGCIDSDTISISNSTGIIVTAGNPACHDESNGSIAVNTDSSGISFSYVIKNSLGDIVNTSGSNIAPELPAGYYFIEYTDSNCTSIDSIKLINPPPINVGVSITNPLCYGDSTGTVFEINLSGYQGELDSVYYSWTPNPQFSNGLLADSIWGLHAREYSLEVVDYYGCVGSIYFDIVDPPQLNAIFNEPILPFCRTSDMQTGGGVVSASADPDSPGTGSVSYEWKHLGNGQTSDVPTFSGIREPGTIELTLIDANGCEFTDQIYLDSINPVADFDVQSDQFDFPDIYEGTEDVRVKINNLSTGYARLDDPNDDVVFQWNLYANQYPESQQNWFFTYSIDDKVDTIYSGEEVYQACLVVNNYNDCADTTCKEITVHITPELITPNVFTPGAVPNETFFFPNDGIRDFECTVFNRYGIKVFKFNDIKDQWDGNHYLTGKPCSDAVYYYVYKAISTNDKSYEGEGQVSLLRNK